MAHNDIGQPNQTLITGRIAYGYDGTNAYPIRAATSDVSSSAAIISTSDVPSKTVQAELLAAQSVAASTQVASSVLSLTGVKQVTLFIDHGRANTVAFGTNGTEYRVEVNQAATGNKWRAIASVLAGSAACLAVAASADVAAAGTAVVVTSGTSIPTRGDIVFWANTVSAASSEWMRVKSVSGTASFTLENGLDSGQDSDTNIFTQAEEFVVSMDVRSETRLRLLVNNNASGTTQAVYSRVACITES
jgi:hypothetical protein